MLVWNPDLCKEYSEFMRDYLNQNHMSVVTNLERPDVNRTYYNPHHCVLKTQVELTKLGEVFGASAK